MDSTKSSVPRSSKSKFARTIAKVLHVRATTGITPVNGVKKSKLPSKPKEEQLKNESSRTHQPLPLDENKFEEDLRKREALEAVIAKIFASISSVKASYAQLQCAQTPYDAACIELADKLIVTELKNLSEVKQSFIKKQFDLSPEDTLTLAEIKENKSLLKTYEIMGRKLEVQAKAKQSEAASLMENLTELNRQNRTIEKKLNQSGPLSDNLHLSGINLNHFATFRRHAMKSVRSFVRLMIDEMKSANWNIDAAAYAIEPEVTYSNPDHKCFAFESFVCREMFGSFQTPNFSLPNESLPEQGNSRRTFFFGRFSELKPLRAQEYLARNPRSAFAKFCMVKYLQLVHPKMESAFFGNLTQRNLLNSGSFPETNFFATFAEMARRVWLLHCLAFSFEAGVSVFQVAKSCRFSDVYMETMVDETSDSTVAFTVVPGFVLGKTVLQCKVYVSNCSNNNR